MNELKIAPSTIEVGGKSSVELSPFELKNRNKRKEDFTKTIAAIASGDPEAALDYSAVYSLEDDYDKDQEAIQTFVALQLAAIGDKNAAMSLFDNDDDITTAISSLRSGDSILTGKGSPIISDLGQQKEESLSPDFSKLSRQRLALGGLPQTAPVNRPYLDLLRNKSAGQPPSPAAQAGAGQSLSPAAQAGVGPQGAEYFDNNQSSSSSTYSGLESASAGASSRTSAGATLAAIGPNLATTAMDLISGQPMDAVGTARGALGRAGPNSSTALGAYSMLGRASTAITNPNLDLNIVNMSNLASLGLNAANTVSNLNQLDLAEIPNEITNAFSRVGQFISDFAADPRGTINSGLDIAGTSIAYGRGINAPVSVSAVPEQPFTFDARTLEVSTKPGFLSALFAMAPAPIGLINTVSGLVQDRNINQLSDFSKAKSYQAWDMVAAHTQGQMGISDAAKGAGVSSLGVGFSGMVSATINNINVTFDPFAEEPVNTITSFIDPQFQSLYVDPLELDRERQELEATVGAMASNIQTDPEAALSYANNTSDLMNASFSAMNTISFSELEQIGAWDETDLAGADYAAGVKGRMDAAHVNWDMEVTTNIEFAQTVNAIANSPEAKNAQVGLGFARGAFSHLGQRASHAFGTPGYYSAQRDQQLSTAQDMAGTGDRGPGSFAGIGLGVAQDYNSQNPSFNTLDAMEKAGLTSVSPNPVNNPDLDFLGRAAADPSGFGFGFGAPGTPGAPDPGAEGLGYGYGYGQGGFGATDAPGAPDPGAAGLGYGYGYGVGDGPEGGPEGGESGEDGGYSDW